MQPKFTQRKLWSFCAGTITTVIVFALSVQFSSAQLAQKSNPKATQSALAEAKRALIAAQKSKTALSNDAGVTVEKQIIKNRNITEAICTTFTGTVDGADPTNPNRFFRDGIASTCGAPKACPGPFAQTSNYELRSWTNPLGTPQCVTITFTNTSGGTFSSFVTAYNGAFVPGSECTNYIADCGGSPAAGASVTFSFNAPGGATIVFWITNVGGVGVSTGYTLDVDAAVCSSGPCSGTPAPGNTIATPAAICPGTNFTLTLQNNTPGTGVTYQWQSAPANSGPWTNISGATNSTYTGTQTSATWYRCNVTCSGNTGTSTPVQVTMAPLSSCYCTTTYTNGCTLGDYIANVTLGTLNNTTTCGAGAYTYFNALPAPSLVAGGGYPLSITLGPDTFGQHAGAWIDFNQDGDFNDPGECLGVTGNLGPNGSGVINFVVPVTATTGVTRLRVRGGNDSPLTCAQACGVSSSSFGETEDYNVNIVPCVQITSVTGPSSVTTQCSQGATFSINLGAASLPTIGWEYRTSPAGLWQNVVNGAGPGGVIFAGATTATLTLSGVPSTISGYQFRAYYSNPCTAIDFSPTATLTVVPLVATVTPTAATICNGQVQQLTLTNATSPTTSTFNATTGLPWAIPDNNLTGQTRNLTVSGIPANAVITEIRVNFTMTHTWVGDIIMNLQGPHGQTLNLIGLLDGGSGSNGTANFTNTSVSSDNSRPPMSGAPAPRTGIFRADLFNTNAVGPTILPTTVSGATAWNTFLALGGSANGTWTLGVCDAGPGDLGNLTSWSVSITYGAPAAGVWTANPATPNTMWLNAGATIPYVAGSQQTTIYVNPAVSTNYSVVYTTANPTCVSNPTVIPVTVLQPLGTVVQPVNRQVCVGGTTTFNITAPGGPFSYQWEESRDNGLTWNPVSNGGVYSGATTNALTLTGVTRQAPSDMNNYRYRCVVTTTPCAGSFTSSAATLTVHALPTVTISATDLALLPNETSTITGTSVPAPGATPNWAWTRNGAPIPGATTASVIADIDRMGVFQATVTDINGCRNSSNELLIDAESGDKLWIYPNPNNGQFQVRLYYPRVQTEKRKIEIFNSLGQKVQESHYMLSVVDAPHYQRFDIDLNLVPKGTYLVRVIDTYTGKSKQGFVIKQ